MLSLLLMMCNFGPQLESQGAGPCIVRGISSRGRQKLNLWNSPGVRVQGSSESEEMCG